MPWKEGSEFIADNKDLALARLQSVVRKISKNPEHLKAYHEAIMKYPNCGYAEKVCHTGTGNPRTYHMPHSAVIKMNRETNKTE